MVDGSLSFNNQLIFISHIAFVDGIIIFGEASLSNIQIIIQIVETFCKASG